MSRHGGPDGRGAAPRPVQVLDDQYGTALGGYEAAGSGGEGAVGAGRVLDGAELAITELADRGVGGERRLGRSDDEHVRAPLHGPGGVRDGVQAARLVAGHHPAGALEAAADGDLSGAGRVEPGDGLVGPDEPGPLPPEFLQFPLAELAAAGPGRGHHADGVRRVGGVGAQSRVFQGGVGGGQGVVGETVGLDEEGLLDERRRVEPPDLAGDAEGEVLAALPGYSVEDARALLDGLPVGVGVQAVGRDHAHAGDGGLSGAYATTTHRFLPAGPVRRTADWNPPKPLPTESTLSSLRERAVRGT